LDGLLSGNTGSNELAASREAKHEVLLNKTKGDVEVSGEEAFVNVDRGAAVGVAEVAMIRDGASIMVDNAIRACNLGTDDALDLVWCGIAVEAGGDEDRNAFDGNTRSVESAKKRRKGSGVGRGASYVAHGDGCRPLSSSEDRERGTSHRMVEGVIERLVGIAQGRCSMAFDGLIVEPFRQKESNAVLAKCEISLFHLPS